MPDFSSYLEFVRRHYEEWWSLCTLTDAIVFTTRDLNLGGDFGIEKRLEMQPLREAQMRSFVV